MGLRVLVDSLRVTGEKLQERVHHAKTSGVHVALGFKSWTAYLADVFGEKPLFIEKDDRPELHRYLFGEGMSTRAIAAATHHSQSTVVRDLAGEPNDSPDEAAGDMNVSPAPHPSDLRSKPRDMPKPGPSKPVVTTGLDDKSYPRPEPKAESEPKKPRRQPLPEAFHAVSRGLAKNSKTLTNLTTDDRLSRNQESMLSTFNDLARTRNEIDASLTRIASVVLHELRESVCGQPLEVIEESGLDPDAFDAMVQRVNENVA